MGVNDAFNFMAAKIQRPMTLERPREINPVNVYASRTNYSRITSGLADTTVEGNEWLITKAQMDSITFPKGLRRGDILRDPDFGAMGIEEVIPITGMGGTILGYRVRTS